MGRMVNNCAQTIFGLCTQGKEMEFGELEFAGIFRRECIYAFRLSNILIEVC